MVGFNIKLLKNRLLNAAILLRIRILVYSSIVVLFCLTWTLCLAAESKVLLEKQTLPPAVQNGTPSENHSGNIELKINEVKKRLVEAKAEENEQKASQLGITLSQLQDRSLKLQDLETVYQRLITALRKKTLLEKEEALLGKKWDARLQVELSQEPPYSLGFYDDVLDQLAMADQKKETAEREKSLAEKAMEDARSRLDEGQQTLRKYKEKTRIEEPKLNWEIDQAQLEVEIAQAIFDLQSVNQNNLSVEIQLASMQADVARENIAWVRKHLLFDKADLEKQLADQAATPLHQGSKISN